MAKVSKNRKQALEKVEKDKVYSLKDAVDIVKNTTKTKFDASVDVAIRLGIDPRQSTQMVRGTVALPHGTGKDIKVLVLCNPENEEEAKKAGADHVGLDEYVQKISKGWTDVDVIITTPQVMPKIAKLGKVLGPRGLMPNPKSGTVTTEIEKTVKEVKAGKIDFKVDKYGIIHSSVGIVSFESNQLADNLKELLQTVTKLKPAASKGIYMRNVTVSSTMGIGVPVETKEFA
ncbi:MAG: 50S ribosomal protein L1 [Bacteroidetes bacterium]|nr:50S ribosomal protein L1 [Bacteroidia bacterium]PCH67299.1 MAG: 50S ribosomal protein L1 [Bacteroidota bacterium]